MNILAELRSSLSTSMSDARKHWAQRVVHEGIPLESLLGLLHADEKTAQRFTWLIGDILELDPGVVEPCLPLLFSLRDQMPFPGMRRSVAKLLWYTNVPEVIEAEGIPQLLEWLGDEEISIGCKHYCGKALFQLAEFGRVDRLKLGAILDQEISRTDNDAYRSRTKKMRQRLEGLS